MHETAKVVQMRKNDYGQDIRSGMANIRNGRPARRHRATIKMPLMLD